MFSQAHIRVIAPDYMKPVFDRAAAQFYRENKIPVILVYKSPDSLLEKAKADFRSDIVFFPKPKKNDYLESDSLLNFATMSCPFKISTVFINRIEGPQVSELRDLKKNSIRRFVMIDPELSYEGDLCRRILEKHKVWDKIGDKLILARSSEHLLTYLETGEADAALAFEHSFAGYRNIVIKQRFDDYLGYRLHYCGLLLSHSRQKKSAQAFLDFFDSRLCRVYELPGVMRLE